MTYAYIKNGRILKATCDPPDDMTGWLTTDLPMLNLQYIDGVFATVEPESGSEPVSQEITNWQCKKQLLSEGLYDTVNDAVVSMDTSAQIDWLHAAIFRRDYPLIVQMQQLLGKTDEDINTFFIEASKLN